MSFQSFSFLAFLAVTLAVCLTVGRKRTDWGKTVLSIACWLFCIIGGGWESFLCLAAGMRVTRAPVLYLKADKTEKQPKR